MNDGPKLRLVTDAPEVAPEVEAPQETAALTFEELPLAEVKYGEDMVGTMTDEETLLFVAFYEANEQQAALHREIGGGMLQALGSDVRSGKADQSGYEIESAIDPEMAKAFWRAHAASQHAKNNLFFSIGERLGFHDWSLGIRTKRRIVKTQRKW